MKLVGWITTNDIKIFSAVNQSMRCLILDLLMPRITHLGGATWCLSVLIAMIMLTGDFVRIWAIEALLALICSHLVVRMIKKWIPRQRPYLTLPKTRTFPHPLNDYSFPSGHTTAIFSVTVLFSLHLPILVFILLPLAVTVGLSRMYLGLHYPTDCIIGACIGSVTALIFFIVGR